MRPAIPRSVSTGDHLTPAPHAESHASRHAARHAHPMPLVASGDPVSPTASIRPNRIRRRRRRTLDGRAPGPPPSARHPPSRNHDPASAPAHGPSATLRRPRGDTPNRTPCASRVAADSVITASSITSREHDSTPASASMMSPMTAADMAGVSIAMSSSAPPLLSIPVARTTPVGPADSPRQRVRLLCGVPYGAGQFGDLAWGHG